MEVATIGQYRVTGIIGQGGMGAVYAAEHTLLGRAAAIKILLPELSQKQEVVTRFFNEARAAAAIRHPGIVEIYDFGWTPDGAAYLVMERLDGETLARRSSRGLLPWSAALAIGRQIAGALGAAHAKGIVHRDLKPDNVFLVLDPEVPGGERIKLLDFGIAKLAGETSSTANVTRTGAVLGTPTYMAPEQCRGVAVDRRADLYALGCVMFELCTGKPPFIGEGIGDVLAAHIHMSPPTLSSLGTAVPTEVEQLIQRLLAKSPAQRVQTADELIHAIDALAPERASLAAVPARPGRASTSSPSVTTLSAAASASRRLLAVAAPRQARSVAIVAGTAALITVVVVALAMRRRDEPATPAATSQPVAATVVAAPREPAAPLQPATPPAIVTDQRVHEAASRDHAAASQAPATDAVPTQLPHAASAQAPVATPPAHTATPPQGPPQPAAPPPIVDLAIDSVPAGAQVTVAGEQVGTTPYQGSAPRGAGKLTVTLHLDGYLDKTLVVHPDHPITERIKLKPDRDQSVNPYKP